MGTKLILVEGLPGSGKSTTAKMVKDILDKKGIKSKLYSEGDYNHPADFDGVSYFDKDSFNKLEDKHIKHKDLIDRIKVEFYNGYLIPYKKAIEEENVKFDDSLFQEIIKNDIYELPLDIHIELLIKNWRKFSKNALNEDKVIIFECCFIQNPITVTMIRDNAPKILTIEYIKKLEKCIEKLEPILIYVNQKSIEYSFEKVIEERPKDWFDGFKNYYTSQGYGLAHNLKDTKGVIEILKERAEFEKEIYDLLEMSKYKIDNSKFDIELLKEKINSII